MAEMSYLDFELEIGPGSGREHIINVRSPAGEAREILHFPFDELSLENRLKDLQIALLRSGNKRRRALSAEELNVQDFGRALFNALLAGEVRGRYDVSHNMALQQRKGLRLKLSIQAPELAALPWEFLYDPRSSEFVCLSRNTPIVRYLDLPHPIPPFTITPPLRILGLVSSPFGLQNLDIAHEKRRVEDATESLRASGSVELTWLSGQTWRDLQQAMWRGPWHIFHFIGHGGFDRVADEGMVMLADEEGQPHHLNATQLGRLLADHASLRLVVLNSCEGARGSEQDIFSSTAAILVRRGIPAVLAMQYEITDHAAIAFSRAFYEAFAAGMPVDTAVVEARIAVSLSLPSTVEWGTPVLYMRSPDGHIIEVTKLSDDELRRSQIALLMREAQTAVANEEWQTAQDKANQVLALDKTNLEARIILKQLPQEQEMARLCAEGLEHHTANRLQQALDSFLRIQESRENYKNVNELVAALDEEIRREKIAKLLREARQAEAAEDWSLAIETYQTILHLEPVHTRARVSLNKAQEEQELAKLYAEGQEHEQVQRWPKALETYRQVQRIRPHYKEVEARLGTIEKKLAHEEKAQAQAQRLREQDKEILTTSSAKPLTSLPAPPRPRRTILLIAALAAIILITFLVFIFSRKQDFAPLTQTTLFISTDPAGASVFLNKDSVGVTPLDEFAVKAGTISLYIQKAGYLTIDTSVVIKEGESARFAFIMERILPHTYGEEVTEDSSQKVTQQQAQTVTPTQIMGTLKMESDPTGASIQLDGKDAGFTPKTIQKLKVGNHTIVLRKEWHKEYSTSIRIESQEVLPLHVPLKGLGRLEITSQPSGATILLNGQNKGTTPAKIQNLEVGTYRLSLKKDGFIDYITDTLQVLHRQIRSFQIALVPIPISRPQLKGELNVLAKPSGAVFINGRLQQENSKQLYTVSLPTGKYLLTVANQQHGKWEKQITIEASRPLELVIDFNRTITLTVVATPVWGDIYVDSVATGRQTPAELPVPIGLRTIEVRRSGYTTVGGAQIINLDENTRAEFRLDLADRQ